MKKFFSAIGSLLGFLIILLYAFENSQLLFGFTFEGMDQILGIFDLVKQYLIYALAGIVGFELVAERKVLSFIFFIILAFVVITTFFPDVVNTYLP